MSLDSYYRPEPLSKVSVDQMTIDDYFRAVKNESICLPIEQRPSVWTNQFKIELCDSMYKGMLIGGLILWPFGSYEKYKFSDIKSFITGQHLKDEDSIPPTLNFDGGQKTDLICNLYGETARGIEPDIISFDLRNETFYVNKKITKKESKYFIEDLSDVFKTSPQQFPIKVEQIVEKFFSQTTLFGQEPLTKKQFVDRLWKLFYMRLAKLTRQTLIGDYWTRSIVKNQYFKVNDQTHKMATVHKSMAGVLSDGAQMEINLRDIEKYMQTSGLLYSVKYETLFSIVQRSISFFNDRPEIYKVTTVSSSKELKQNISCGVENFVQASERLASDGFKVFKCFDKILKEAGCLHLKYLPPQTIIEGILSILFVLHSYGLKINDTYLIKKLAKFVFALVANPGISIDVMSKFWKVFHKFLVGNIREEAVIARFFCEQADKLFVPELLPRLFLESSSKICPAAKIYIYSQVRNNSSMFMESTKISSYIFGKDASEVDVDHIYPKSPLINIGIENHSCVANYALMSSNLNRSKRKTDKMPSDYYPELMGLSKNSGILPNPFLPKLDEQDIINSNCLWENWYKVEGELDNDKFNAYLSKRAEKMTDFVKLAYNKF